MAQRPSYTAAWLQPPCGHPFHLYLLVYLVDEASTG